MIFLISYKSSQFALRFVANLVPKQSLIFFPAYSFQAPHMKLIKAYFSVVSLLALTANGVPLPPEDGCVMVDYELWCDENLGGSSSGPKGILCHNSNCARMVSQWISKTLRS
jgi:hypothetical protein